MLSIQTISLLITTGVVGVVLGSLGGITYCRKKSINIDKGIDTVTNIVQTAEPIVGVADALFPNNPAVVILKTIEKWAKIAAGNAEQLKHAGDISGDQRADTAEKVVNAVLKELNIDVTENRKILMDAAIKDIVNSFGHTEPTEAQKQAQLQQVQQQLQQQMLQNQQLQQKLAQVQSAVGTTTTVTPAITK